MDPHNLFTYPVSRLEVPDYHEIVKDPMDWQTISEKLSRNEYLTAKEFQVSAGKDEGVSRVCPEVH